LPPQTLEGIENSTSKTHVKKSCRGGLDERNIDERKKEHDVRCEIGVVEAGPIGGAGVRFTEGTPSKRQSKGLREGKGSEIMGLKGGEGVQLAGRVLRKCKNN